MAGSTNLRRAVSDALVDAGFVRVERMHLIRLDGAFQFVVDTGPLGKRSGIAPWVGLRHDAARRVVNELLELPPDDYVGTVGAYVGYVLGDDYCEWREMAELHDVLEAIGDARAVLSQYATLDRLADAWKIRGTQGPGYCYSLVVVAALRGEWREARSWLAEAGRLDCKFEDELCEQFRRFERNVRARYAELA